MLKAFDGCTFQPHGIIPAFSFKLGDTAVEVEVELVDVPLDYNLLLGCSWTYTMKEFISSVYRVIKFPHKGKVVTIDQLSFFQRESTQEEPDIPLIDNYNKESPNVGIGLYPTLMGTINFPMLEVYMISRVHNTSSGRQILFKTSYLSDPWNLPNLNDENSTGMAEPLSAAEVTYKAI